MVIKSLESFQLKEIQVCEISDGRCKELGVQDFLWGELCTLEYGNWKPKHQQRPWAWSMKKGTWFWKATIGYCNYTSSMISMRLHLQQQNSWTQKSILWFTWTDNSKGLSLFSLYRSHWPLQNHTVRRNPRTSIKKLWRFFLNFW